MPSSIRIRIVTGHELHWIRHRGSRHRGDRQVRHAGPGSRGIPRDDDPRHGGRAPRRLDRTSHGALRSGRAGRVDHVGDRRDRPARDLPRRDRRPRATSMKRAGAPARPRRISMTTPARVFDHPIHPMLIPFPIGLWVFSLVADLVYRFGGDPLWLSMAYWTMVGGTVGALVAAVPGLIDFLSLRDREAVRIGTIHMVLNLTIVGLFVVNLILRTRG